MTTGGTVNYTDGYGRTGGPNPALLKDYGWVETKSFVTANLTASATLLTDASSMTGNAESFYTIWHVSAAHDQTTPWMAYLWETNTAHVETVADGAVKFHINASAYGGTMWSSETPVKLAPGRGLQLDSISPDNNISNNGKSLLTIGYILTTPTS